MESPTFIITPTMSPDYDVHVLSMVPCTELAPRLDPPDMFLWTVGTFVLNLMSNNSDA